MCKTFAEVAMEVIREDWELRKEQNNPVFNQERIAQMMGISRSQLAKALTTDKNPTISFICSYATAVGRPMDELLYTIGRREVEEQRSFLISNQMTARAATDDPIPFTITASSYSTTEKAAAKSDREEILDLINSIREKKIPLVHCRVFIEMHADTIDELDALKSKVKSELSYRKISIDGNRIQWHHETHCHKCHP